MDDLKISPIGIGSSIMYVPQITKSQKVLANEKAKKDERKRMELFLEREENIRRNLPDWIGKYVNMLI